MKKITYLIGAGASVQALPVVREIPTRIEILINYLLKEENTLNTELYSDLESHVQKTKRDLQKEMIDDLKWIKSESEKHASIDTYAKKLTITGKINELRRLKLALSVFIIMEQLRCPPDKRYDTFIASLISTHSVLPPNVRIISWNYDYQFEISYAQYSENETISNNQSYLGIKHKYGDRMRDDGFGIYKLNGTTGLYTASGNIQYFFTNKIANGLDIKNIELIVRNHAAGKYLPGIQSSLSFAWEPEYNDDSSIVKKAIENTKSTDVLIVLGYSFPFFNRDIDRQIINSMKNLSKVYLQSPEADAIKERFHAMRDDINNIDFVLKFDTEQFLLPNEL